MHLDTNGKLVLSFGELAELLLKAHDVTSITEDDVKWAISKVDEITKGVKGKN